MAFLKRTALSLAEYVTPVLTTSQFYKSGQLTPEEYVLTGDQLVSKCTSWHWGSGNDNTLKDYLPKDKQYLYTKSVPCLARVLSVTGIILDETAAEDDWTLTTSRNTNDDNSNKTSISTSTTTPEPTTTTTTPVEEPQQEDGGDDDEIPDLDELDYGDLGEAEEQPQPTTTTQTSTTTSTPTTTTTTSTISINQVRTYDISIVYDKLYRCPRVYLQGYDSNGKPLTEQQVQQDISGDHMNKTVTWEQHPYTNLPCMSIHPCQHAHTMKRMLEIMVFEECELIKGEQKKIEQEEKEGADKKSVLGALNNKSTTTQSQSTPTPQQQKKLTTEKDINDEAWNRVQNRMTVDKSLFLFLKFVATVIPTIDYDNTINFDIF